MQHTEMPLEEAQQSEQLCKSLQERFEEITVKLNTEEAKKENAKKLW